MGGGHYAAIHEAGHAVAAVRLRLSLRYVTLRSSPPDIGSTYCTPRGAGKADRWVREAVVAYAGYEADVSSARTISQAGSGSADDFKEGLRLAQRAGRGDDMSVWIDARRAETRALITEAWGSVEAVANELKVAQRLSGREVRAIVARSARA
jgi:hypothetical protein